MKTWFLNCKICATLLSVLASVFGKLLCFIKKSKKSEDERFYNPGNIPISIQIQGDKKTTEIDLVDWNNWGEEGKEQENEEEEKEIPAQELFKDMEPTINKAKVVHVTRKIRAPSSPPPSSSSQAPFAFRSNYPNGYTNNSRYTPKYQVETELGTMDDDDACGWDDDDVNDIDIDRETDSMIKHNRQLERQKRAEEQRRKKLEKDQLRIARKQEGHIGVKIS